MKSYAILDDFTFVFSILVKFDIYFLGVPWEIVFDVIYRSIALEKC